MKVRFILGAAALGLLPAAGLAEGIYVVDEVGNLIRFDSATPGVIESMVPLTGLGLDDPFRTVGALDFRPATGRLYALVDQDYFTVPPPGALHGDLYLVDPGTGAGSLIGIAYEVIGMPWGGFDFSPVDDDIRIFGGDALNLRMNPSTAEISVETPLAPEYYLVGLAFDHNQAGATASTLFGLDVPSQDLVRIGGVDGVPPPSGGEVTVIGPLGIPFSGIASFDISPSGTAYAALSPPFLTEGIPEPSQLYTVNLETGAATLVGAIGPPPGLLVFAMAVAPEGGGQGVIEIPALGPWGLFFLTAGLGVAGMLRLRRRRPARR